MKTKRILFTIAALILISATACDIDPTVRMNMVGMNYGNTIDFTYETFTGYEVNRLDAIAGETIRLVYDMEINKGSLHLQVIDPDDSVIWEEKLLESESDTVDLRVEDSGKYVLRIDADNAGGSMEAEWYVKEN